MPRLIFPTASDGLYLDVVVGLDGANTTKLLASGQPIPAPLIVRGAIDTGSNATAVSAALLQQLSVPLLKQSNTQTFSGSAPVNLYSVSLALKDRSRPAIPSFALPTLMVMAFPTPLQGIDVVVGLDVLLQCKMILDGPARQFSLEF